MFQLRDLRPYTNYTITVRVVNTAGKGPLGEAVLAITAEGGVSVHVLVVAYMYTLTLFACLLCMECGIPCLLFSFIDYYPLY